jgi:hypothetical protein
VVDGGFNYIFITSTAYRGDFGGVANADAFCAAHAADAGLPGIYRAWLATADAGPEARLGNARGWVGTNGRPFADTIGALVQRTEIFYPLSLDEHGRPVRADMHFTYWTGTQARGAPSANTCNDWTDGTSSFLGGAGKSRAGDTGWTEVLGGEPCDVSRPVLCFGVSNAGRVVPIQPTPSRLAFLAPFVAIGSQIAYRGITAADAVCAADAADAGLPGSYRALLAQTSASAASRFSADGGPWVRLDGAQLTATADGFLSGASPSLDCLLDLTIEGDYAGVFDVWTGAPNITAISSLTCNDWTSSIAGEAATVGTPTDLDQWFSSHASECNYPYGALYCLQE